MSQTSVSYLWREPRAAQGFHTGVSLHSHTSLSRETLDFVAEFANDFPWVKALLTKAENHCAKVSGIRPDYANSFWTPPLTPRLAFDLERNQIENTLNLPGLVSISDHDEIGANLLLRALPSARETPISVEWSVPYANFEAVGEAKPTAFHIGIHNLPSEKAKDWIARLNTFTNTPVEERPAQLLAETLAELASIPNVLIIFNHPLWDLYRIGREKHEVLVNDFLVNHGQFVHALELNGLRDWTENRNVHTLAGKWNQLVVSGGDRHGIEPNANVNLSTATTFDEFVYQMRRERISHVLFMPQYKQPWKHRILQSTLDAIRNYPHFPEGSRRWDERVFHPDADGKLQPVAALWGAGRTNEEAPIYLRAILAAIRTLGSAPVSGGLRWAWNDEHQMRAAMAEQDA
jgi:hypothetical protein